MTKKQNTYFLMIGFLYSLVPVFLLTFFEEDHPYSATLGITLLVIGVSSIFTTTFLIRKFKENKKRKWYYFILLLHCVPLPFVLFCLVIAFKIIAVQ